MPPPIQESAANLDLSPRLYTSSVVAGSPAAAVETIVASVTITGDIAVLAGVHLFAFAAFTVGTNGVSVRAQLKRTNAAGTTVLDSGITNEGVTAATQLGTRTLIGFDAFQVAAGGVYVLTLTVGSASAPSTVSAVTLTALVV
jgi:hypothetical protein